MELKENILRIKEVMGLIVESKFEYVKIEDVEMLLPAMTRYFEVLFGDRLKMIEVDKRKMTRDEPEKIVLDFHFNKMTYDEELEKHIIIYEELLTVFGLDIMKRVVPLAVTVKQ